MWQLPKYSRQNMIANATTIVMNAYFQCKESKRVIHHGGGYSLGRTRTLRVRFCLQIGHIDR